MQHTNNCVEVQRGVVRVEQVHDDVGQTRCCQSSNQWLGVRHAASVCPSVGHCDDHCLRFELVGKRRGAVQGGLLVGRLLQGAGGSGGDTVVEAIGAMTANEVLEACLPFDVYGSLLGPVHRPIDGRVGAVGGGGKIKRLPIVIGVESDEYRH